MVDQIEGQRGTFYIFGDHNKIGQDPGSTVSVRFVVYSYWTPQHP